MKSVVEQIIGYGIKYPQKIALCDAKHSMTYGDLVNSIIYVKNKLQTIYKVSKGDTVIVAANKQLEFVSIYFACHLIGAVVLPIAPDTNKTRFELIKQTVSPALIIGFKEKSSSIVSTDDFLGLDYVNLNDIQYPQIDDIADVMFTTGTTGKPKGVKLSHKNLSCSVDNINTFIQNKEDDVEMLVMPFSHSFGISRMRCALSNGQTVVLQNGLTNMKRFFYFMDKYHVTGIGMVPAGWALLKKLSGNRIIQYSKQLHYIEIGSAPMLLETKKAMIEMFPNTRICMHYGLTEASRSAFLEFHEDVLHLDTVGRASPHMQIVIKDDLGNNLPNGQEGEICVKGGAVTTGYINPQKELTFWGEFFRTGDWGVMDDEGYIKLLSRKKELINVGGKKVSPVEVEDVLLSLDFIDDCACVASSDPDGILGEVVKAYVVTSSPEKIDVQEISKLIGGRLERYKHPAAYGIIKNIPRTMSGKVQRLLLK